MAERYPENSEGDFYTENGVCMHCSAPEEQAPDLIAHSEGPTGHCYFRKQPQTTAEIEQAIRAISVSCISELRYGGTNENILKMLIEMGEGGQCDHQPEEDYKPVIWWKAGFESSCTEKELTERIMQDLFRSHPGVQIIDPRKSGRASRFTLRWYDGPGHHVTCTADGEEKFVLEISQEQQNPAALINLRNSAIMLNSILRDVEAITRLLWYDKEGNGYPPGEVREYLPG